MSSSDVVNLIRQKEGLLRKLADFEGTNKALRKLLKEQSQFEVCEMLYSNGCVYVLLCYLSWCFPVIYWRNRSQRPDCEIGFRFDYCSHSDQLVSILCKLQLSQTFLLQNNGKRLREQHDILLERLTKTNEENKVKQKNGVIMLYLSPFLLYLPFISVIVAIMQ